MAAVCLAVVASACGSNDNNASPAGSKSKTSTTSNAAALGTPNKATGTAVTIGMITEGGSEAIGSQAALAEQGAKIAVQYVNDYLGGVGGHPIDLFVCGNKATPAGAVDCANQMVEKKVAAVVWPFTGQGASVPIITGAGIPVIATSGSSAEELTTTGVFVLTGGYVGTLGAFAQHAKDNGVKKLAMVVIDVPAATQAANAIGNMVFKNAGVGYEVVPAAPGTPDLSPQLQQAASAGADAIAVTGDVTFCTSFLKAYDTLALHLKKYVIGTCNDQSVVKSLPKALEGAFEATTAGDDPTDLALYAAMVDKYASGKDIDHDPTKSSGIAAGVGAVMNFASGMKGFTGEVTPAGITDQFKKVEGKIFLSGGLTFKCDGTAIPLLKNICSSAFQMAVLNADGSVKSSEKIDASSLFKS